MSSRKSLLLSLFGAGIAFWIPDVLIPALDRNEQGGAVTIVCPAALILFYFGVLRLRKGEPSGPSTAIFAICGMWASALSFTMLAQTVRSNGFVGGAWTWGDFGYLLVSSSLPWRIVEFVTLEGSIIALWVGTVAMFICHIAFERTRWVVPPNLFAAVKSGDETRNN
jgi:hypothetical protein